ncbi:hydroxyacylglutathione hydrolase [Neptunomonas qingdaonensis]|uniref:Hydroxyacylglutathione hydrolase n=1 Tax=Neptunomonas qingdaonensis TaxID=1045558 RepID=A0A1I2RX88_9GAMM|nr:hydroxyacylglutathione hydrolase [Neptunomonas qingdaonensis]SFG42366.1 hydroxyacylglutathione hydrolase [Neptunomonas qingdaonensis]
MFIATALPAFTDNYIWMLTTENSTGMVVVDPGDADVVIQAIKTNQKPLAAILLTHHHPDHTGGVKQLTEMYSIPVYGPANSPFKDISHPLTDQMEINILGETLIVKEVPGHTLDHICYFQPTATPQLFCGDTLFLAGCGRLFEGSAAQMLDNMHYFTSLPANTNIYCTHEYSLANLAFAAAVEPNNNDIQQATEKCRMLRAANQPTLPSNIAQELKINPFMRSNNQQVQIAAQGYKKTSINSELDTFTAIREWKNNF